MTRRPVPIAALALVCTSTLSCAGEGAVHGSDAPLAQTDLALAAEPMEADPQPLDEIFSVALSNDSSRAAERARLPGNAYGVMTKQPQKAGAEKATVVSKIEPRLRKLARQHAERMDETVEVIVTFKDDSRAPRLPRLDPLRSRDSIENQQTLSRLRALREGFDAQRAASRRVHERALTEKHRAKVKERLPLIDGYVVQVPWSEVEALAARPEVQHVEFTTHDAPPPISIVTARGQMNTDTWFNLGFNAGWIGLVDTGVTLNHTVLLNPNRIDFRRDCVNSTDAGCAWPNAGYNADDCANHGTGMASIVSGNNNLGDNRRGISGITVDSFKMYGGDGCKPHRAAATRAIDAAINAGDSVILVEAQDPEDEYGALATAADRAFDHGIVVIAANGNDGGGGSGTPNTVRSPANAQKVLGIGAINPDTMLIRDTSSRGPANDARTKPDLMALDYIDRATTASNTSFEPFSGTSTASAVATGGIALLANWMRSLGSVDPGQVYATAIAMTDAGSGSAYDQNHGAGLFRVPNGYLHGGAVSLGHQQTVTIQRAIAPGSSARVAIWWPEVTTTHNDIDVTLTTPSNVPSGSASISSVFEKVRVNSNQSGTWTITISGYNVISANPQVVYWALVVE